MSFKVLANLSGNGRTCERERERETRANRELEGEMREYMRCIIVIVSILSECFASVAGLLACAHHSQIEQ